MGHQQLTVTEDETLEEAIGKALNGTRLPSTEIASLIIETRDAIGDAEQTVKNERERSMDLATNPQECALAIFTAEILRDRLRDKLPKLQQRYSATRAAEAHAEWLPQLEALDAEAAAIEQDFMREYPEGAQKLVALFQRVTDHDRKRALILAARPDGIKATSDPLPFAHIVENVKPPAVQAGAQALFPPPAPSLVDFLLAPQAYDPRYSADWWKVKQAEAREREAQLRAEAEKRQAEIASQPGIRWWEGEGTKERVG